MKMKKIRTKICFFMLLLVLIILFVVWLLQVTFLQDLYEYYKAEDVKQIQAEMVEKFNEQDVQDAYRSIWEMAQENELYVAIYDSNKKAVMTPFMFMNLNPRDFRFDASMFENYQDILDKAVSDIRRSGSGDYVYYSKQKGGYVQRNNYVIVVSKIEAADGEYYILTRAPLAPVKATTDIIKRNYGMILIVGFLLAAVTAFLLSEYISRPIRALSKGAKAVASGDLEYFIPEKEGNGEMGMLIHDFNCMTQELSKVDNLRKDLIANVSHELRTPLTMIKGYAETIRDLTGDNPEKRNKQLDIIVEESDRLTLLIRDILDLSQLQAGKTPFKQDLICFSDTVKRIANRYDYFKDKGYKISVDVADNVYVTGDEDRLEQVIYNLVDNAINHSGDEQKVDICLTGGTKPRLSVTNSGEPISADDLPYIWDRFYHMDKSGKRRVTGTGIGLSIVREVLEIHGFAYGVSSDENGTVFWFEPYEKK